MDKTLLEKYANLIVKKGLNIDPGQEVYIIAGVDQMDFLYMVVEKCYQTGASRVHIDIKDQGLSRLAYLYMTEDKLGEVAPWELATWQWRKDNLPALLWLDSDDPSGLDDVDATKRANSQIARYPIIKPFRDATENRFQWCIAGVPGVKWAKKVFPNLDDASAVEKLWEAILYTARVDENCPIENWNKHNEIIHKRCEILNNYKFKSLHYQSSNGTNLTVGLMEQGIFAGGSEKDLSNREFNPNIPSEEIFTTPKSGVAEGIVYSSKPLSYQGKLIENFSIEFKDGKAVAVKAETGPEDLEKMIAMDEGAARLGECALIGKNSPINNLNILFYSTLYDENASCHFAMGRGFDICVDNFAKYTKEELISLGVNDSMIHVDFMIGTDDLEVSGITEDGTEVAIFRNGDWVF